MTRDAAGDNFFRNTRPARSIEPSWVPRSKTSLAPRPLDHFPLVQFDQPAEGDVRSLRELLVRGRTLEALSGARRFAPFEAWSAPRARRVASGICDALGAPQRALKIELGTYRRAPRSAAGRLARMHLSLVRRGPLETWQALRAEGPLEGDATEEDRAELVLFEASVLAHFRDFERAMAATRSAGAIGASARRVALLEARILFERDRHADALAAALRARDEEPDNPDALLLLAHLHLVHGAEEEALSLLRDGATRTQSASLALKLVALLEGRGLADERRAWIERWAERVPLLERGETLAQLRADSACERGDLRAAVDILRRDGSKQAARLAEHVARAVNDPSAKRALLDVPFVRQHHMTCAPATLTALARYWRMPADHLEVAEAICYDGTPAHSQRTWAEEHGFVVRELTVTWDVVRALIDRGVPFTVAVVEGASAHLQAIVGYDERRGTLLLRDSSVPVRLEALAEDWLETWQATGPHGMALVPRGEEARIADLALPDEALYDSLLSRERGPRAARSRGRPRGVRRDRLDRAGAPARNRGKTCARGLRRRRTRASSPARARWSPRSRASWRRGSRPSGACRRFERVKRGSRPRVSSSAPTPPRRSTRRPSPTRSPMMRVSIRRPRASSGARTGARPERHGPLALVGAIAWSARRFEEALLAPPVRGVCGALRRGRGRDVFRVRAGARSR